MTQPTDSAAMLLSANGVCDVAANAQLCSKFSNTESGFDDLPDWVPAQEGTTLCSTWTVPDYPLRMFTHQQGAARSCESNGQPGKSNFKLHTVVPAGLRPQNQTTCTHVWPADTVLYSWAPEQHDPGPTANLGRGLTSSQHTAAFGVGCIPRTQMTEVSYT